MSHPAVHVLAGPDGHQGAYDSWGVVTIGADRCHVLDLCADHPLTEGPDLLRRLGDAPRHTAYTSPAGAGLHIDPARRSVGWWLLGAQARAAQAAAARGAVEAAYRAAGGR
ncbi:hypothetical protein AB0C90_32160 [Streptomyces sp. NPDC048550]|uniref:hypothetical protein n=1 Tax=Streptomyces sp. NPDC048550 TaxID=3155739 RepID=UPI00341C36A0